MRNLKGVKKFERLFRVLGSMDVDKSDILRLNHFINDVTHRLLQVGMRNAKLNNRDVIWISDLPITMGLEAQIQEFEKTDEEIEVSTLMEDLATLPPLPLAIGEDVQEYLAQIQGGIVVALVKCMKTIAPGVKNPQTEEWEKARAIFQTLL